MAQRVPISKRLLLINSSSSFATNLLNISVLVWLQQHLIKRIEPAEYAIYPLLMAVLLFVPLLSTLMIGGVGRFVTEAYARGDERRVTQIVSTLLGPLAGVALLLLIGGGAFAWFIDVFIDVQPRYLADARLMMALLVGSAAVRLVATPVSIGLFVRQRFMTINLLTLGTQVLRLTLLLALLYGVSTRVLWVVVATVVANLAQAGALWALSRRAIPALRFDRRLVDYRTIGRVASFNAWIFISHLANMLKLAAEPWLLHHWADDVAVWCMSIGSQAYDRVDSSSVVATQTAQPALTALHTSGDRRRLGVAYLRGSRYALWLVCLIALPVMIYAPELMRLYLGGKYEEFSATAPVLILIFATFPLWYSTLLLARIAEATASIRLFSLYAVAMSAANLALSFWFVIGLDAGAVGTAAGRLVASLLVWPLVAHLGLVLAGVTLRQWLHETVWLGLLPGLLGAVVWLTMKAVLPPGDWLTLAFNAIVGGAVYAATLLGLCLRPPERDDLRRLLGRLGLIRAPAAHA